MWKGKEVFHTDLSRELLTSERCHILEILNQAEIPGISLARARVEPGIATEWHRLDVDEVYYILEGGGIVEIGQSPGREVGVGDAVLIRAGQSQRITNTGNTDLVFLCICTPRFHEMSYESVE